jgi:peptidoglycan/LPS O-acetylase OafA/YrhL
VRPRSDGLGYQPALDGVRAVAIAAVIGVHLDLLPGGGIGVLIFFVLSGFLITSLLLHERRRTGTISLKLFYARRGLRLLPALLAVVAAVSIVALTTPHTALSRETLRFVPAALFYFGNWLAAQHGYLSGGALTHTWSLSVEEQFYIVWGLLLVLLLSKGVRLRAIVILALLGAFLSDACKVLVWSGGSVVADANRMYSTYLSADGLMLGCALAVAVMTRPQPTLRVARAAVLPAGIFLMYAIVSLDPFVGTFARARAFDVVMWPLSSVAAAVVIAYLVLAPTSPLARLLSLRPFRVVGKLSYGLYLWHYPILIWLFLWFGFTHRWWQVPIEVGLAVGASAASYLLIERRALRLKRTLVATTPAAPMAAVPSVEQSVS